MRAWGWKSSIAVGVALAMTWLGGAGTAASGRNPKPPLKKKQYSWIAGLEFRSIDGSGNNRVEVGWGSVGAELLRTLDSSDYGDGVSTLAGQSRLSARAVSNIVAAQPVPLPNPQGVTDMVWQWGHFLDQDIDLTPGAVPSEPANIAVLASDALFDPFGTGTQVISFNRSTYHLLTTSSIREQVNVITAYIDGSNVYGSDAIRAGELRAPGGRLKTSAGRLLPFNTAGLPNAPGSMPSFFLAGDVRANEQVGLTALHTLFVREHNRLVRELRKLKLPEETRYQVARAIVGAELQAITYREFLPLLLGKNTSRGTADTTRRSTRVLRTFSRQARTDSGTPWCPRNSCA